MPRVTTTQQNFTAGEISPRLYGRSDIARYMSGAKTITNGIVLQHGGVRRRDGTVYVANAGGQCRLLRYVYNRDEAYILEFGVGYIRFFDNSGQILTDSGAVYSVTTTYTSDELFDIEYTQAGNLLFIAHRSHKLAQLERFSRNSWGLSDVKFTNEPVKDDIWRPPYALQLDVKTVGKNRVAICPIFTTSDYRLDVNGDNVSRKIYSSGGGEAIITGNVDIADGMVKHTIEIIKEFESTTIAPQSWWIDGPQQTSLNITGTITANSIVTLSSTTTSTPSVYTESCQSASETTYYSSRAAILTIALLAQKFRFGDILKVTKTTGEVKYYTVYQVDNEGTVGTVPAVVRILIDDDEDIAHFTSTTCTHTRAGTAAGYNSIACADDVGSIISCNSGYIRITGINNSTSYSGVVTKTLSSGVAPIPDAWYLMRRAWNSYNGYPASVTTWEQRLVAGGTNVSPNTIWFSKIGNYYDFLPGTLDDDSLSVTIAAGDEQADIVHLTQGKALVGFASNGEYTFIGGVEKPIAPTNIQIRNQSVFGCSKVRPVRVGNEIYFIQRSGRKMRAFSYKYDATDDYGAPDMSIMSEHLMESGIKDVAYCAEPESILWMCRNDGVGVSVTIERDNDVMAWTRYTTDGLIESVSSIPSGSGGNILWAVINRGGTRYIEKMQEGIYLDCAKSMESVSPQTAWGGLSHLEGRSVGVIADGVYVGNFTVSGGAITLNDAASNVTVGINYTTTITTLMQDFGTGAGSVHGNSNRIGELTIRFLNTVGCNINGSPVTFRKTDTEVLDYDPESFTGTHRVSLLGWSRGDVSVTISQTDPVAMHIQQLIYKFTSND